LYGWTLFLVIQAGTIAAAGVGFGRYLGILWPRIAEDNYLVPPIHLSCHYALSLSAGQLVGVLMITLLTWINSRGIQWGKVVQNCFTSAKLAALLAVIVVGIFLGWNAQAVRANFSHPWTPQEVAPLAPGLSLNTAFGLLVAMCVAQVGSMFAADAWNNITFTAGEVTNPRRNLPLSLAFGTFIVMGLYFCANIAYLVVLPLAQVQHAPSDRVAGAVLQRVFPAFGGGLMAATIMVSAFGCANGKVLTGARAYYIMARDGLFFRRAAALNRAQVPGAALIMQGIWASLLVLIRTYEPSTATSLSFSQTSTTVLAGTVYDPSDAVVIGATVTALNVATGVSLKQTTQQRGTLFLSVNPCGKLHGNRGDEWSQDRAAHWNHSRRRHTGHRQRHARTRKYE
jgi:APA family basic amino acid/polyamine antiporter